MPLTLLGTPSPIYLIGESHTLIFRNLLFRAGANDRLFQCRIRFLPHVMAQNFFQPASNAFHPDLLEAFRAEELLRANLAPSHLSLDGATISGAWMEKRSVVAPALVLCIGDLDLHHLFSQFAGYDFELPNDAYYGVDRALPPVAYATLLAQVEKLLAPYIAGLRTLRTAGFTRMLVHCVPPRTADDVATQRWTKVHKSVRAKLTVMANQVLARECAAIGIPFIDIWQETSKGGYLLPEFDLDGMHLTAAAAQISLDKVVASLHENTWSVQNNARYMHAANQAKRTTQADAETATVAHPATGICVGQLTEPVHALQAPRDHYRAATQLSPRIDWSATPSGSRGALQSARPSAEQLALAAQLLSQGVGQAVLHGAVDYALTVSSFRPSFIAAGNGPLLLARATQSDGVRKAVLRLGGEGTIGFASADGNMLHVMSAASGALAVYDPATTVCLLDPRAGDISLVEIALIPLGTGQPFRVTWSDLHEWPLDPFQYSVADMQAHPPFGGEQVTIRALTMV